MNRRKRAKANTARGDTNEVHIFTFATLKQLVAYLRPQILIGWSNQRPPRQLPSHPKMKFGKTMRKNMNFLPNITIPS